MGGDGKFLWSYKTVLNEYNISAKFQIDQTLSGSRTKKIFLKNPGEGGGKFLLLVQDGTKRVQYFSKVSNRSDVVGFHNKNQIYFFGKFRGGGGKLLRSVQNGTKRVQYISKV